MMSVEDCAHKRNIDVVETELSGIVIIVLALGIILCGPALFIQGWRWLRRIARAGVRSARSKPLQEE
jgi:hypothetical protein